MKNLLTGFVCTCLLIVAGNPAARAQDKKPDTRIADQTQPADAPAASDADQQTPATPQQTPPAGQTPQTGQTPVPPPAEDQPTTPHSLIAQPPPPPPKIPDVRRPGETGFWVDLEGWLPKQQPYQNGGKQYIGPDTSSFLRFQGTPKYAENLEAGMAVGLHNTLKLTLTNFHAVGDYTSPIEVTAYNQTYSGGTYISTNYHVERAQLSYEYLTWPYPVGGRKIRLKTLWQVQVTNVSAVFDSPLDYYDSNGNLILDSSGQPINLSGTGTKRIISPEFGLGLSYYPSRHVRVEFNGGGFGLPHRYSIWDGDASVNVRVLSHVELRLGVRGMGFKTSTNSDFYIKGNYYAPFVGIRWYSNSE
ncbi:MAG TPA: hypothetical protein VMB03_25545 [Bryobacteraceae bacterium]|nr:hypothetical protein [Bryobacteraceae bacterium]